MGKLTPDYSFTRDGISLRDYLWRLVDENATTRVAAGGAIQAMWSGFPTIHTDIHDLATLPDMKQQAANYKVEIRAILAQADFDTATFVRKLTAYRIMLNNDWLNRVDHETSKEDVLEKKFDRMADRLTDTINTATDEEEKDHALENLARLIKVYACSVFKGENPYADAESMSAAGMMSSVIYDSLDRELMTAPDGLELLLQDRMLRGTALSALQRIGPAAAQFATGLIRDIESLCERGSGLGWFDGAIALGSIGKDDPYTIGELIRLLKDECAEVRQAAAQTVEFLDGKACGRSREFVAVLRSMMANNDDRFYVISPLASVGRDDSSVRNQIIELAAARPSRSSADPQNNFDDVAAMQGRAISALAYFQDYADECMPAIISAMDNFEEYDPDMCYGGACGRVSEVLRKFGPKAAAAVDALTKHLNDDDFDEIPTNILYALVEIGPVAKAILPQLEKLRKKWSRGEELADLDQVNVDESDDRIGWVIQRIREK